MVSSSRRRAGASLSVFLACIVLKAWHFSLRKDAVAFANHPAKISLSRGQWNILDKRLRKKGCTARNAVGLFFNTQTGNTEEVAGQIASATGLEAIDYDGNEFDSLDGMIVGCPTWNTDSDEYRSGTTWDDYVDQIKESNLKGKTVAVFGCGDSQGYGHNFCDGIEELHDAFKAAGAKMVGYVDASDYDFQSSKSVRDGKFLGMPLDQDNEADKSESRVATWIEQLKAEGMPF
eukprot:TRINITY_DN5644_c2_g1_i1.p1 TRINITY_DN5644_c2_g1~~TRINITY_DN5644_c2_g1_i1.p1  ORF type:complete len:233 (-),score=44.21 TRINITY_DN5644_c2_g1_i1:158-856(-)